MKRVNNISLLKQSLEAMYRGRFIRKVVSFGLVCTLSFSTLTFSPNISHLTILATGGNATTTEENNDTTEAEIAYSLQFLEHLPKPGESGFEKFTTLPDQSQLKENRENTIRHKDSSAEVITINEKEIYTQIEATVKELIEKVESRTPSKDMTDEVIKADDNYSSHYELPKEMRVAKAIYRWVAKNISYDYESIAKDSNGAESFRKPQDALFVFSQGMGVCAGYARLTDLMMKMAGIPCTYLGSINGKYEDSGHAFNAVYINDTANNRQGWTLIDSTWASPQSDKDFYNNRVKNLMEGKSSFFNNIFEIILDRHDEYIKELEKELNFTYEEIQSIDDSGIEELNQRTEQLLKRLNGEYKEGRKFESIEFKKVQNLIPIIISPIISTNSIPISNPISAPTYSLQVKYKTNITMSEAIKIIEENNAAIQKSLKDSAIECYIKNDYSLFTFNINGTPQTTEDKLNYYFLNTLDNINSIKDSNLKERSNEYTEKVRKIYSEIIVKYSEDIENNENNINTELNAELTKLNVDYQDIIIFKQIKVSESPSNTNLPVKVSESPSSTNLPGIMFPNIGSNQSKINILQITTSLSRKEAEELYEKTNPQGKIGQVNANMEIYFPAFYNSDMTLEDANRSIIKQPFHKVALSKDIGPNCGFEINDVRYSLYGNETKAYIEISGDEYNPAKNVTIPEEISKLQMPLEIASGIESINLTGDETIMKSYASDLVCINLQNSSKYILEGNTLYKKTTSGEKGDYILFMAE